MPENKENRTKLCINQRLACTFSARILPYTQQKKKFESILMKKIVFAVAMVLGWANMSFAASYGDLYGVEWCPCNPEESYDAQGSVVLGKTVMCPCDAMYDGYNSTMEKDVRKLQHDVKRTLEKAQNFKYYVGIDYNKSQVNTAKQDITFDHLIFSDVGGLKVPAGLAMDHQDNIGFVIGARPHSNLGIEAFYNRAYSKNTVTQIDNQTVNHSDYHMVNTFVTKYQAYGVDFLGYLPVTDYFDFIAFVGLGEYRLDNSAHVEVNYLEGSVGTPAVDSASFDFSEKQLAWRVGGGIQFNIARGLVLRSMYRYIKLRTDTVNSFQEYSIGVRFLF